ncbi:MAG TPA: YigZ family protein [Bacillales bacterium]|nr:YigZ family protein [Bacillales bacterium]
MLSFYYTVNGFARHCLIIQKSQFIASVNRVETESEALDFIEKTKREFRDANHNCSAYLIGKRGEIQKANDDGEPSGTAGVPMLEGLKKLEVRNTVVVTSRYFGGIKLGAGGLIRAYSSAATAAIKKAGIVKFILTRSIQLEMDYTWLGKLENELRSKYSITRIQYEERVKMEVLVPRSNVESFVEWVNEKTNGQSTITYGEWLYEADSQ